VVQRDVATCRKIFSRARVRIADERPRFAVDRSRHHAVMRRFFDAVRGEDIESLVTLLDDAAVLHGDGGGNAVAIKKPIIGGVAVGRFIIAVTQTLPPGASVEEAELNGAPALVAWLDRQPLVAVMIDTDGERIRSVFAISNPDKLGSIVRRLRGSE